MKPADYYKLGAKGYVTEKNMIANDDTIIGRVLLIQPNRNNNNIYKDTSEVYKSLAPVTIEKVYTGIYNNEGYDIIKCRVRSTRSPTIGDMFCIPQNGNGNNIYNDPNNEYNTVNILGTNDQHKRKLENESETISVKRRTSAVNK